MRGRGGRSIASRAAANEAASGGGYIEIAVSIEGDAEWICNDRVGGGPPLPLSLPAYVLIIPIWPLAMLAHVANRATAYPFRLIIKKPPMPV